MLLIPIIFDPLVQRYERFAHEMFVPMISFLCEVRAFIRQFRINCFKSEHMQWTDMKKEFMCVCVSVSVFVSMSVYFHGGKLTAS